MCWYGSIPNTTKYISNRFQWLIWMDRCSVKAQLARRALGSSSGLRCSLAACLPVTMWRLTTTLGLAMGKKKTIISFFFFFSHSRATFIRFEILTRKIWLLFVFALYCQREQLSWRCVDVERDFYCNFRSSLSICSRKFFRWRILAQPISAKVVNRTRNQKKGCTKTTKSILL